MSVAKTLRSKPWLFYVLCLSVFLFGGLFQPGDWYTELNKAPWSPPNIAFPIAWTLLYIMIAVAGHQISKTGNRLLLTLWCLQLVLNAIWSWLFFGQHWIVLGLIDLLLLLSIVVIMLLLSKQAHLTKIIYLLMPYACWLALATSLNAFIVFNN